mmetsp:Transcript_5040/g.8589  ORF Transcript_5040/g.8589 Transcript_5040/m.8589 type:complete len:141 (+) Transcript_5040:493-915(+)|eukprot:CAMPEP_0168610046 /NCGR_PEP_ID=MMETSP0449_2-20121227/1553_1 /TAXON_ID=1082188 /ORGANISM="Strombidium rassoulzadegani, Strain ras09" /LENGTH=140 /DNA_ID=CAMNT_0008650275 /DNA_START=406 /DNA_END=828 /DNA_ORIENTATION=-
MGGQNAQSHNQRIQLSSGGPRLLSGGPGPLPGQDVENCDINDSYDGIGNRFPENFGGSSVQATNLENLSRYQAHEVRSNAPHSNMNMSDLFIEGNGGMAGLNSSQYMNEQANLDLENEESKLNDQFSQLCVNQPKSSKHD